MIPIGLYHRFLCFLFFVVGLYLCFMGFPSLRDCFFGNDITLSFYASNPFFRRVHLFCYFNSRAITFFLRLFGGLGPLVPGHGNVTIFFYCDYFRFYGSTFRNARLYGILFFRSSVFFSQLGNYGFFLYFFRPMLGCYGNFGEVSRPRTTSFPWVFIESSVVFSGSTLYSSESLVGRS